MLVSFPDLRFQDGKLFHDSRTVPDRLLEMSRTPAFSQYALLLRESAKLIEALRIGLKETDEDLVKGLSEGESALLREIKLIRQMLVDEIKRIRERRDDSTGLQIETQSDEKG
jgi:hypothetical protein